MSQATFLSEKNAIETISKLKQTLLNFKVFFIAGKEKSILIYLYLTE